ncbi:hypothetical protein [Methylobacillus glycogenes]|uniref:hypothetical protein n=1 Tax=Methylobacillus glycogenes TaxID=406 RepID=UPI000471D6A7|nr:hypothetical protein [Methylobacillus glycogenes]
MTTQQTNPLNGEFWVDAEYGQRPTSHKATQALTATYGAIGIAHLIERSISEMHSAKFTEHEYAGLEPVLLENLLCAQKVLLEIIEERLLEACLVR